MRRVVVTGAGSINALGAGVPAFLAGLRSARCAIGPLTCFSTAGYRSTIAAEVHDPGPPAWMAPGTARHASRTDLLALTAAHEALAGAGLPTTERDNPGIGVVLGTTTGGMFDGEEYYRRLLAGEPLRRHSAILAVPVSVGADKLAHVFRCTGPRLTVSTACSSGANAIGVAADWIRRGQAHSVLCGGADSLCRMTYSGFNALQALDAVPCRPFDRNRAGLTLGEGAAMFVLEDLEHARARGATVQAEVLGYGNSADAYHITHGRPDSAGMLQAMRQALADARIDAGAVDYVNAHGTGTPSNDVLETRALRAVLDARADMVPVSSTKSMIGHCLAAAGAIEALATVLAIGHGFVPATATLEVADPQCDLDYVPRRSRAHPVRIAISNSYGFGGNNSSLILGAPDG
ncbi:beta-ketoacyl-[acyl-carrier-protein] synthase family protein [Candidatus Binatia bacterium]|nr:beta-ketoacyl-[acyl-carrier-protein] synthase family protein [Candidatus Binatia bacterium]